MLLYLFIIFLYIILGYGKFHYGFLLLCGAMFLCVGCQNGINAYILPSAECDLNLTSEQKGLLNVSFLLGILISLRIYRDLYIYIYNITYYIKLYYLKYNKYKIQILNIKTEKNYEKKKK